MSTEPVPAAAPAPTPAAPAAAPRPLETSAPVGWVIAAMILFWPTGIPALLASHRAARAIGAGDAVTADREAGTARRWGVISVIVGAALIVLSILISLAWAFVAALAIAHSDRWDEGPRWNNEMPFDRDEMPPGMPGTPGSDG